MLRYIVVGFRIIKYIDIDIDIDLVNHLLRLAHPLPKGWTAKVYDQTIWYCISTDDRSHPLIGKLNDV